VHNLIKGEKMPKEIKCPECGSINIEEIPYKAAVGPGGPHGELPKEAEYQKYECLDCGMVFFESNLRE
jgi:DNA-directed RNA polymerase subunit RPC12/RpoP